MRHLFITCFVHFSQICQDNPKTMGTSCLPWQVGVRKKFPPQLLPVRIFLPSIFFAVWSMLFSISAHYFCQLRPKPWREKKCWMIFFQRHRKKKGLMFLLSWKMTIFPIFLCLLCVGDGDQQIIESCLRVYDYQLFFFICENKR